MTKPLEKFYAFLDRPLFGWTRIALVLLVVPLLLTFTAPLWRISLAAPQYPKGLWMDIYTHKIESGNNGQHLSEINNLNHYIGMKKIDRAELADLDWLPFALGVLALLALRCAAIGNVRMLIDLVVIAGYVSLFAMGRFAYKLYVFGHDLAPDAAMKLKPFTPPLIGTKEIANFTTTSLPQLGSLFVGIFVVGIGVLMLYHLIAGRMAAAREERAAAAATG
jgi:copper chaperone NosL